MRTAPTGRVHKQSLIFRSGFSHRWFNDYEGFDAGSLILAVIEGTKCHFNRFQDSSNLKGCRQMDCVETSNDVSNGQLTRFDFVD